MASNKYLINCLVLVQPDFEINEVLNSIIIVRVRCEGGGRGLHVLTEMHFLLQKNLKNIMHGRVKMYVMR